MNKSSVIKITAFTLSVLLHVLVFLAFGAIRFSLTPTANAGMFDAEAVTAQIKQIAERQPVTPKPRMVNMFSRRQIVRPERKTLELSGAPKIKLTEDMTRRITTDVREVSLKDIGPARGVVFFGQVTDLRKICYVVDASGSMHGRLGQVKQQLKSSIGDLKPDQYFYVIFFQDADKLIESGKGKMIRATTAACKKAFEFIDSVNPSGPTNAVGALRRAMEIRDSMGNGPEQIYFLTDGFDLQGEGGEMFAAQIENMRKKLAPAARINTIGFWVEADDVAILRKVAAQSGGEFTNIE